MLALGRYLRRNPSLRVGIALLLIQMLAVGPPQPVATMGHVEPFQDIPLAGSASLRLPFESNSIVVRTAPLILGRYH